MNIHHKAFETYPCENQSYKRRWSQYFLLIFPRNQHFVRIFDTIKTIEICNFIKYYRDILNCHNFKDIKNSAHNEESLTLVNRFKGPISRN